MRRASPERGSRPGCINIQTVNGFASGRGLRAGRHFGNRLQDLRRDLVGVALRVRTAVFQMALVAIVDEGVRNADRSAAIGHAIAELVPRSRLVLAGQTLVVV